MTESIYKVIQLVGSSETSWEEAAKNAIEKAGQTLRDLRIAEVEKLDMKVENGKVASYRARVNLSFKYGGGEQPAEDILFKKGVWCLAFGTDAKHH